MVAYNDIKDTKGDNINPDFILSKIDDYSLFKKYIGDFKLGQVICSPLRKDKNPSFSIYHSAKYNKLLFKDHGSGESGDVFVFLQKFFKLGYRDTLVQVINDLELSVKTKPIKTDYTKDPNNYYTEIGIVRQKFTDIDIAYWNTYGISLQTLKKFNVFSINYFLINGIVKGVYKDDQPMYAYQIFDKFKIYRPLSHKTIKWRSNTTNLHVQGYEQLPKSKGDLLIITKSLKDVMVLYEMGYTAISPSSETSSLPIEVITALRTKYNKILVLFDNDETGIKNAEKLTKQYNLRSIFIPNEETKDISDYVKSYGIEKAKDLIENLINDQQSSS